MPRPPCPRLRTLDGVEGPRHRELCKTHWLDGDEGADEREGARAAGASFMLKLYNCENVLIAECECSEIKRNSIAITYRLAMDAEREGREKIDWLKVNTAIINRWSKSGLQYIKLRAWKGLV